MVQMDSISLNISKLVSLTFDENPEVRKDVAKKLGEIDDPAAKFALIELSFDKDTRVREAAQKCLDTKKTTEPELMSFATIFAAPGKEELPQTQADVKEKVLRPITQIFERRLGKERAEMVKSKMMPSIEKIYQKATGQHGTKRHEEEAGRKVIQEFLTDYLEVMSDLDSIASGPTPPPMKHDGPALPDETHGQEAKDDSRPDATGGLAVVGKEVDLDKISLEIASVENQDIEEMKEMEEIEHLPDTFFKKAYETMMLSNGDEDIMQKERDNMIGDAAREIGLAFRLAKKKFKENKLTNITKIKNGMRNINTEILTIKSADTSEYQKTKKVKDLATRIVVNDDGGNEGVIYLYEGRGAMLKQGMRIKVSGGGGKTLESSNETAIVIGKKGNVYIVL
jgi:hypothetical protein